MLDGVDTSHGVQIKLSYGQARVDTKGIRLMRADTASSPSVDITDVMGNVFSSLKLHKSSLYTLIISDPGKFSMPYQQRGRRSQPVHLQLGLLGL